MIALQLIWEAAKGAVEAVAALVLLVVLLPWIWCMYRTMEEGEWRP